MQTSASTSSHVSHIDFGKEEEKGGSHAFPNSRDLSRSSANPDRRAADWNISRMSMNSIILSYWIIYAFHPPPKGIRRPCEDSKINEEEAQMGQVRNAYKV